MKLFRMRGIRRIQYAILAIVIFIAAIASLFHLLTPYLNEHKAEFEIWASRVLNVPVKVRQVKLAWHILEPQVTFHDVVILDVTNERPIIEIKKIKVDVNIFRSLISWKFFAENIQIIGAALTVHQKTDQLHIEGLNNLILTDNTTGENVQAHETVSWIFGLPRLKLKDISIHYIPKTGISQEFSLVQVILKNNNSKHNLKGQIVLKRDIPTVLNTDTSWRGDILHPEGAAVDAYFYVEGASLSQWLHPYTWHQLKIEDGIGSFKVWFTWDKGEWQKIQTQFAIYDLRWKLISTQKTQILPRISGKLGWKREAGHYVLAGDEVMIDFVNHLWPTVNFVVEYDPKSLQSVSINYFNIQDIKDLLLINKLLPESLEKDLLALSSQGELHAFRIHFNEGQTIASFSTGFKRIGIKEWKKIPEFQNVSGLIAWNGKEGSLKLNSFNPTFKSALFNAPLKFQQIKADIDWRKENEILIKGRNIEIKNADVSFNPQFSLTIPGSGSPIIRLTANFAITNAINLINYVPLKLLKPDLQQWLTNAFHAGSFLNGKIVIEGRVDDFPFDNNNGNFEVTSLAKDVQLHFAPNWPNIQHLEGALEFSKRFMKVAIHSATLADIPLNNTHLLMQNIGKPAPELLLVESDVQSDFTKVLRFLNLTPLKTTIGNKLDGLQLQGPMQLQLELAIPVAKPITTRLLGNIKTENASLNVFDSNFGLKDIMGELQFNDKAVKTGTFTAKLFDAPVHIALSTHYDYESGLPSYLKTVFTSNISLSALQNEFGVAFGNIAEGAAKYSGELQLPFSSQSSQVHLIIHSNLQGINLKLPEQFGKNTNETRALTLQLFASSEQPLKIKMDYSSLLSAAVTLQKSRNSIKFLNGELRIGPGATWQEQPGLLISGKLPSLNWEKIKSYLPQQQANTNSVLQRIDLTIGLLEAFGQQFKNMHIQAAKSSADWIVKLRNADIVGQITLPENLTKDAAVQANFERLHLKTQKASNQSVFDPSVMPGFNLHADDVQIDDKPVGKVLLTSLPTVKGVTIKHFEILSALLQLEARGEWLNSGTHFVGEIASERFSDLLTAWHIDSKSIAVNKAQAKFDLNWLGAPFQLQQQNLTGTLSLAIDKGRIIDVGDSGGKVGLARMLNIFSLQTIPRRLSLDFSDLFKSGYSFDYMKGDYIFKNGNAFTENSQMDGPIAKIELSGRIGLVKKDFDLTMGVTPYVTGSLPVVATIVSAFNPLIGIATFAMDRAIPVSKILTHKYKITGAWDKPVWTELGVAKKSR